MHIELPPGKRLHSYRKLPFIVDLPIKNSDFHRYVTSAKGKLHGKNSQEIGTRSRQTRQMDVHRPIHLVL